MEECYFSVDCVKLTRPGGSLKLASQQKKRCQKRTESPRIGVALWAVLPLCCSSPHCLLGGMDRSRSVVAQSLNGVDARGSASGDVAGQQRDQAENRHRGGKRRLWA